MKYKPGDIVWLAEFDSGEGVIPRQKCLLLSGPENDMYTGLVHTEEPGDDGLREFSEDQIEGLVDE